MRSSKNAPPKNFRDYFVSFAKVTSATVGSVWSFLISILVVVIWAATGPLFHFSDTWQLVINTGTTIVTFLMVFLIQSTQNRDAKAVHLKLDELIRAVEGARNHLVDLEDLSEAELEVLSKEFSRFRDQAGRARTRQAQTEKKLDQINDCADAEIGGTVPSEKC